MSTIDSPTTTVPQSVAVSRLLYIIGAALGLVGAIVVGVTLPASIATATSAASQALQGRSTNGVDVGGAVTGLAIAGAVLSIVLSVAFSILTFVFASKMRDGRNWARIVLAVFTFAQLFGVLGSYGAGAVHFLVMLVAFILSVVPTSNAWFREVKAARTPAF
jgi:hypothetical protein